jgi:hypothetical protein
MPDSLSVVDSKPLPSALTVVSSQPLEPSSLASRVISGVGHTLQKTADNLNVENVLRRIGNADDLAGQGRWADAWNEIRGLLPGGSDSQQVLGNQQGSTLDEQKQFVQDTYNKAKSGDYSGAGANVLTAGLANAEHAGPVVDEVADAAKNAASTTATAAKGAAKGVVEANKGGLQNPVHGAAFATSLIPVVGHKLAAAIEAGNNLHGAVKGARQALQERAAAQAEAEETETAPEASAPEESKTTPAAPVTPPAPESTPAPAPQQAPSPGEDREFLDQIARAQTKKPFAKLTPAEQAAVRTLAQRLRPSAAPAEAPPPATSTGPATPPSPADAAIRPASETPVLPSSAAPRRAYTESEARSQSSGPNGGGESPNGTTLGKLVERQEYYPPQAEAPKHIPSPAELGFGVYGDIRPDDSSTLDHIRAENEKAFNAADFAFRNGITNPEVFDRMSEAQKRDFMLGAKQADGTFAPGALQHGRAVGNPTPKTTYRPNPKTGSILDGHTLRLAKAHLAKMAADAQANGNGNGAEGAPAEAQPQTPESAPPQPKSGAQLEAEGLMAAKGRVQSFLRDETGSFDPSFGRNPLPPAIAPYFQTIEPRLAGRPQEALRWVRAGKGRFVPGAIPHPDFENGIGLLHGEPGNPNENWQSGFGVSHIDAKHPGDLDEAVQAIPSLPVIETIKDSRTGRVMGKVLSDGKRRAVISMDLRGHATPEWLLTSYTR